MPRSILYDKQKEQSSEKLNFTFKLKEILWQDI